ncbi:hypothetical protein PBI_DEWDROP_27 [Microbacterium phage Dewdrop]|nr:hypothetical protein PBI_LEAF_27 [Microbacterium phage Leaf]QGZ17396.1 hypothetical protein PBI_DEWDROP_27 [Microbacterium phage Dewdrop]
MSTGSIQSSASQLCLLSWETDGTAHTCRQEGRKHEGWHLCGCTASMRETAPTSAPGGTRCS